MTEALPDWLREHVAAGSGEPLTVVAFLEIFARWARERGTEVDFVALGILQARAWRWLAHETAEVLSRAQSMVSATATPEATLSATSEDPFVAAADLLESAFPDEDAAYSQRVLSEADPRRLLVERTRFARERPATLSELLAALDEARGDALAAIVARDARALARTQRQDEPRAALIMENDDEEIARVRQLLPRTSRVTLRELAAERTPIAFVRAMHAALHLSARAELTLDQRHVGFGPVYVMARGVPASHGSRAGRLPSRSQQTRSADKPACPEDA